ncbi:hypothetical protein LTR85_009348 [Meristemomyces frigidus]|nr:hypothetical protein LTR85_009348 [Meristemomyces frigidus]
MAPLRSVKKDATDKRVQSILDCATKASTLLKERATIPTSLEPELEAIIKRSFPLPSSTALAGKSTSFDTLGSQLWNAATNIIRDEENQEHQHETRSRHKSPPRLTVLLRALAFLLIDAAHYTSSRRTKDHDQRVRTFKIANRACRFCLDNGEAELALKILERSSDYVSRVEEEQPIVQIAKETNGSNGDQQLVLQPLVAEYYLLRMTHAWKSDRFDMADHFFSKLSARELASSADLAEKAAELFHEAGTSLAATKQAQPAIKWCERALSALDSCDLESLSQNAPELRLAITGTLVEALSSTGSTGDSNRAIHVVDDLESRYGMSNRVAVSLMRFQVLSAQQPVDVDSLSAVLKYMIRLALTTNKSFTTRISGHCALTALNELITTRLLPDFLPDTQPESVSRDRLEKATVSYVLFATTQQEAPPVEMTDDLQTLFDTFVGRSNSALSAKATHASQTLIWKTVSGSHTDAAAEWSKLLRHPIFDSAGQLNKARIGRKAIVTAVARDDIEAAREAFFGMPQATRDGAISRYLAFKIALRSSDHELAAQSLHIITKHADRDPTFLYACVLEAQQSDYRRLAVAALQGLLDKQPNGVHLPSLLRCTARLLIGELDAKERSLDEVMDEVVLLFERAGANVKVFRQGTDDQWRAEIQWWSKNAYNLALRLCADIHPEYLVRLLTVCVHFLECYRNDGGLMHSDDLIRRKCLCHFLSTSALIVLARSGEEGSEHALQSYSRARREIAAFMAQVRQLEDTQVEGGLGRDDAGDTAARIFELLKFDLECILRLQQWDQLDSAVKAFLDFNDTDRWDSLADLALIVHEQASAHGVTTSGSARIPELLQKCINKTWKKDKDLTKMSRWLRLTFTIHLQDDDGDLALKIVEQAAAIARKGDEGQADPYPSDELQWLATMAFNKAVDALSSGDTEGSGTWTNAALELARYADDNGSLHANLTSKGQQAEARMKGDRQP